MCYGTLVDIVVDRKKFDVDVRKATVDVGVVDRILCKAQIGSRQIVRRPL